MAGPQSGAQAAPIAPGSLEELASRAAVSERVLITGASGLLGLALLRKAPANVEIVPAGLHTTRLVGVQENFIAFDVRDVRSVESAFARIRPTLVIHAAALSDVNLCERQRRDAWQTNVLGTRHIARCCFRYGAKLAFVSSNAVFGRGSAPYDENAPPSPVNIYGLTKMMAEDEVARVGIPATIVRVVTMFGWNHPSQPANLVTFALEKLAAHSTVAVVSDVWNNPIWNDDAARAIWQIACRANLPRTVHVAGRERLSKWELVQKAATAFGFDLASVRSTTSGQFSALAPRAADTTLSTLHNETLPPPHYVSEAFERMKSDMPSYVKVAA